MGLLLTTKHHNEDISIIGFTVKTLADDGQHTAVLATHIGKITDITKMIQPRHTQHITSSFPTMRTNSR